MRCLLLVFLSVAFLSCEKVSCEGKDTDVFLKMSEIDNRVNYPEFNSGNLNFSEEDDKMVLVFEDFEVTKLKRFYLNGVLKTEVPVLCSNYHGMKTTYYDNGRKYKEINYIHGSIEGRIKVFSKNGELLKEVEPEEDDREERLKDLESSLKEKHLEFDELSFLDKNVFVDLFSVISELIDAVKIKDEVIIAEKIEHVKQYAGSTKTMMQFFNKDKKYDDLTPIINTFSSKEALGKIISDKGSRLEMLYMYELGILVFFTEGF